MRGQHGQGTVEYLAVVLLVAAVMGAAVALLAVTGLGEQVMAAFRRALCVVAGDDCDEASKAAGPCVRASERHADGGQLQALVVRVGSRDVVLRERRADGTVAVTLIGERSGGLDLGTGVEAHVRWGKGSWAVGSELRAAVMAERASGQTWVARDDAEATRIVEQVRLAALSERPETTIEPSEHYNPYPPMRPEVHAPDPDATFSERGDELAIDFRAASRRTTVSLSSEEAYGERVDHVTGRRTVYVRDVLDGRGKISYVGDASGEGEERFGITYDRSGQPVDLMVLSTLDVEGTASLPPRLSSIAGWLRIPLHGSKHVEIEQHLDLTEPASADAVQAFLGRFGEDRLAVHLTAAALRERLEGEGTLSVRTYATDASARQVGGHVKVAGVGVGGELGAEDESSELVAAVARGARGAWGPDPACARAEVVRDRPI